MTRDGWQEAVMEKLPLACVALDVWSFLLEEEFLAGVFDRHRGRSYTDVLSFRVLVNLVGDALVEHAGSARRAIQQAERDDQLDVSMEAVYGKLRRVPQAVSHGFLAECTQRLGGIFPNVKHSIPASLRKFAVLAIDGKKIKNAAKRLMASRKFSGSVLGGKALVALCLKRGLAVAMSSHLDGEANDPPLVPELLAQVRAIVPQPRLYVLDRQFCDLKLPVRLTEAGDHFVIRYHQKVTFTRDSQRAVQKGRDSQGRRYIEEWGWLGRPQASPRHYVRRITLQRPGEEDLIVLTDLLDGEKFPASDLLELYRQRWGIERVFQQITEVFHLQHLIASTPQGTIFQCAFCLLLYNLLQLQRCYLSQTQSLKVEQISLENLFYDLHRQLIAWQELLGFAWTANHRPQPLTAQQLSHRLSQKLSGAWQDHWLKAPSNNRSPPIQIPATAGGHTSVYRLIQQHLQR